MQACCNCPQHSPASAAAALLLTLLLASEGGCSGGAVGEFQHTGQLPSRGGGDCDRAQRERDQVQQRWLPQLLVMLLLAGASTTCKATATATAAVTAAVTAIGAADAR